MKRSVLVSTPDLRPSLLPVLKGMEEGGLLGRVVTTLAIDPTQFFGKNFFKISHFLPERYARGIEKRVLPEFLQGKISAIPYREVLRLLASRLGCDELADRIWLWSELGFDRKVARLFVPGYRCIYGMEHSSLETFREQKRHGGLCVLRAVMAHGRKVEQVIRTEIEKFPEHAASYGRRFLRDQARSLARKEEECRLADLIVANSDFVRDTFVEAGINRSKIEVVPTGCPPISLQPANSGKGKRRLIFLYAGTISLRKGALDLLSAWRLLKPGASAELWLVGPCEIKLDSELQHLDGVHFMGSVSRERLYEIYQKADVLVLPTFLEGLAHVIVEALSQGLPIMTTSESGCGELVKHGSNGWIIPAGQASKLAEAMDWCLQNRRHLPAMGLESQRRARQWSVADSISAHSKAMQRFLA